MSFFYNNCSRARQCCCTGGSEQNECGERSCDCRNNGSSTAVSAETSETQPQTVRALLNTVMDSCFITDDVCREITFSAEDIDPCSVEVGTALDVDVNGDITFREVTRDKDNCVCVSTVRFNIPVRIFVDDSGCGCNCTRCLDRDITVIRSAKLCCSGSSILTTYNSQVIAASAVVSEVCADRVTVTLCLLFRSCLQQTMLREYTWTATPVCENPNCRDARNSLLDSCDTVCGCTAGGMSCPSC